MMSLNDLYSLVQKEYASISMIFSDKLPKRFASGTAYIILNPQNVPLSEICEKLRAKYPSAHTLCIFNKAESGIQKAEIALESLVDPSVYQDDFVILVPPVSTQESLSCDLDDLCAIMRRLRAPDGCPWDAEQTHESLKTSLIEEAYEVLDAIDKKDRGGLIEELGDVLLQIVFHTQLMDEVVPTNIDEISTGIVKKLIYRHPHVFGNVSVANSKEVLVNWEALKNKEKHIESVTESMRRVSVGMPALMRAKRVQKKAAKIGFDWADALSASNKIIEETNEAIEALSQNDDSAIQEELGDVLFSVVNVARLKGYEPELLLEAVIEKFISRFEKMEQLVIEQYGSIDGHDLELLNKYWDIAKQAQKAD